jgi:hypothetical protein
VYLKRLLYQLHGKAGYGMSGRLPLSYGIIRDFIQLTGTTLEPWEVETLLEGDQILLVASITQKGG